jgi:transcription initiation factor TFIID subunit 8
MSDRGASRSGRGNGDEYGRAMARAAVAQALEAAGFDCVHRSAVDALVDVLLRYVTHLGRAAAFHANLAGRTLANECDIINSLEEIGADFDGLAGAASGGPRCLVGSGVVRDLMAFVDSKDELPFTRPLPRFPVPCAPQPAPSFAAAGRETGMRHVPDWLPVFPDPHTYMRTEVWSEQAAKDRVDMVEQVRQRRKAEKSLLSLQQRLALAGADGFRPAVSEDTATKGKDIQQPSGGKRNPFLEPALPPGEREVAEVDMPPERKKLSILEAFAPAIQGADAMEIDSGAGWDQDRNRKSILPKERAPVRLKIGIDKKPLAAAPSSQPVDLSEDPSFLKEEIKDDRKRRAGLILRASMENPQELPQL